MADVRLDTRVYDGRAFDPDMTAATYTGEYDCEEMFQGWSCTAPPDHVERNLPHTAHFGHGEQNVIVAWNAHNYRGFYGNVPEV